MRVNVFVCSTSTDLAEHRLRVGHAIRLLGAKDVSMEEFGARDGPPVDECIRLVSEESDIFVGIYAHRYGHVPPNGKQSITEMEYHAATEAALPRFIYLIDPKHPVLFESIDHGTSRKRLEAFKKTLMGRHICQFFDSPDDLAMKVAADLGRHMATRNVTQVGPDTELQDIGLESLRAPDDSTPDDWNTRRRDIVADRRGIFLTHVAKPSQKPGQVCDVYIYLIRHKTTGFADVAVAEFFLGPYWRNKLFPAVERDGVIGISTSAYGTFLCLCRVTFKDGKQIFLERYIDFEAARDG